MHPSRLRVRVLVFMFVLIRCTGVLAGTYEQEQYRKAENRRLSSSGAFPLVLLVR